MNSTSPLHKQVRNLLISHNESISSLKSAMLPLSKEVFENPKKVKGPFYEISTPASLRHVPFDQRAPTVDEEMFSVWLPSGRCVDVSEQMTNNVTKFLVWNAYLRSWYEKLVLEFGAQSAQRVLAVVATNCSFPVFNSDQDEITITLSQDLVSDGLKSHFSDTTGFARPMVTAVYEMAKAFMWIVKLRERSLVVAAIESTLLLGAFSWIHGPEDSYSRFLCRLIDHTAGLVTETDDEAEKLAMLIWKIHSAATLEQSELRQIIDQDGCDSLSSSVSSIERAKKAEKPRPDSRKILNRLKGFKGKLTDSIFRTKRL